MAIYSAGDKAIFDALNLPAVTNQHLRELFISRGIIISKSTPRRALADYYSRLAHDYQDYQTLAKLFGSPARRERLSSMRVTSSSVDISQFEAAAHSLCKSIRAGGDLATVRARANGSFDIVVKYQVTQFNQTEFRQVVAKEATITVEPSGAAIAISGPHNEHVDEWTRTLIADVGKEADDTLDIDEVSLEHILDSNKRSKFFMELIKSVRGFKFYDVTDAFVYKPKLKSTDEEDDQDPTIDIGVHITKASLKGEGVLQSDELRILFSKGFYLWKIVWQAVNESTSEPDLYEFEAQFSEPESCTRFSYLPRGFYKVQEDTSFNKSRTGVAEGADTSLGRRIEDAARSVVKKL
ncbi:hypothetical protein P9250_00120 [Caballeronia sp. LP006]|uniref:hypothetical protein n=1 Tax=Caballeronia sp. LP006 TaxID=3038552 RepID=UPI00285D2384|nr:hypothetical protein [Caballeronia sp. LP006]MDR5826260.1 hypothetical protein [Caballeronia sp. LP006]